MIHNNVTESFLTNIVLLKPKTKVYVDCQVVFIDFMVHNDITI